MNTKITLIVSFTLIIIVPWAVFWYAGKNERDHPAYYAETNDTFAAVEIPVDALPTDITSGDVSILQSSTTDSPERTYTITPRGQSLSAPAIVSVVSPIHEDTVSIPLLLMETDLGIRPIANTHIDIDYKTKTIRSTGEITKLGVVRVIEEGPIGFEFESHVNEYEVDTTFPISWRIRSLYSSYPSDTFSLEVIEDEGYQILATSTDFSVGYSKEVVPATVSMNDGFHQWSDSHTFEHDYTCEMQGEFDWVFDPSVTLLYAVNITDGGEKYHSDIVHSVTLRVTSKCINGNDRGSDTPI